MLLFCLFFICFLFSIWVQREYFLNILFFVLLFRTFLQIVGLQFNFDWFLPKYLQLLDFYWRFIIFETERWYELGLLKFHLLAYWFILGCIPRYLIELSLLAFRFLYARYFGMKRLNQFAFFFLVTQIAAILFYFFLFINVRVRSLHIPLYILFPLYDCCFINVFDIWICVWSTIDCPDNYVITSFCRTVLFELLTIKINWFFLGTKICILLYLTLW